NTNQAYDDGNNFWNLSYPESGNYWSDHNSTDSFSGPNQDQLGSDGIGDTPYINISGGAGAQDNYPLMEPWEESAAVDTTDPPNIEITNLVGGEDWTGGSNHQIEFTALDTEDDPANLTVFLNYTSGAGNGEITQLQGNRTPYTWTLPTINATDVIVNATVIDSDGNKSYDDSPEFTIDSSPPEVVSTNPANNTTGISIFQPVVIQFNEPMNISSVIVNQTNGTNPGGWSWFWNEERDNITGIHNSWKRGETIEITVHAGYKDDSDPGNANNTAYVFSFTTEINPSPEIIHPNITSSKELGDEIRINATITDDGTVLNAVMWWQDVDDVWHESYMDKNGNDWEYLIPGQMAEGKIRYQINATDDLQQKNTTIIYEFDIEDSTPPEITHTPVESALIDESINITCQVTDLGGVNASAVYFVYRYEGDSEFMVEPMNPGFWYEIPAHSVLATIEYYIQASDIYGNDASTQLYSLEIIDTSVTDTTPPEVLLATPSGDNIPILTDIFIVFSEAVNQTSVESAILISPAITNISYIWLNNETLLIEISGNLSYNTTYTVTTDTGAKDLAGNTLTNDYIWQFTTVEDPEIIQPLASNDWLWIVLIIILVGVILLLLYLFQKERRKQGNNNDP
ncbi:MAG: Ig-like domain-containing protein, partial [Thermoplasmata archaeon]|nr:Ig-like domain-containing protein [Thermoplasmata archaeon]